MKYTLALLALSSGCVESRDAITGTQSIRVDLVSPANPGSFDTRLADDARDVTVNLTAVDADGKDDATFSAQLGLYVQFLGTLSPYLDGAPLKSVAMTNGKATNVSLSLPPVFGPTTLWVDDGKSDDPTYVTGASPALWFRDPTISDIQRPRDEKALDALERSQLELKQIDVHESRYGANGRLVVTSVFAQGYTVADMNCGPGGAPPCTTQPYDSVMVFSFSAPRATSDEDSGGDDLLKIGQTVQRFNGGISEFNGLTEIGFPRTYLHGTPDVDERRLPVPVKLEAGRTGETSDWFAPLSADNGIINFERWEAAPIEIDNAVVCALDADYTTYKQWKIDPKGTESAGGTSCMGNRNVINVITAGVISELDPATLVGKKLPRLVGVVRPVNIGSFNVWIVYPRGMSDLTLP